MICFVVSKNGERLCVAGINGECVLTTIVTYANVTDPGPTRRTTLDATVGGLDCSSRQHVNWVRADIEPGDRIEILVSDAESPDPPRGTKAERSLGQTAASNLDRIKARRKALVRELKDLDRNEAATRKHLDSKK